MSFHSAASPGSSTGTSSPNCKTPFGEIRLRATSRVAICLFLLATSLWPGSSSRTHHLDESVLFCVFLLRIYRLALTRPDRNKLTRRSVVVGESISA
jgi:hypothetical protein